MKNCKVIVVTVGMVGIISGCGSETTKEGDTKGSSFEALYNGYFRNCKYCHVPGAWGQVSGIEQTLDFSTEDTAYDTITKGRATGLVGSQAACNGVPFVSSSYETSLIAAVIDEDVRANFSANGCDADTISDMTVKVGSAPSRSFLGALKAWIDSGTPR